MFISLQNCFETIIKTFNKTKLYNDKYERPEKQDIVNGLAYNYTEFHLRQKIEWDHRVKGCIYSLVYYVSVLFNI